jgi:magnesium-protoporphyrin O-methyltransferase
VVARDALIHSRAAAIVAALARLAPRTSGSIVFTAAPRTPASMLMLAAGRLFPRGDRSPAIEPVAPQSLARLMGEHAALQGWRTGRAELISGGFYKSRALEWIRT